MIEFVSEKVQSIELSGIRKFYNKVAKVPGAISLTLGEPDFKVPSSIKKAMISAIEQDKTRYTSNAGIIELREEITVHLGRLGITYTSEEVCLTIGGSEGLMDIFTALINPGDKVLIPTPAYPAYESCVKLAGGDVINYGLNEDFSLNLEEVEKIINREKPKILVVSYPSNPTGAALSKADRDGLIKIIKENNLIVVSDEIYSSLSFEERYYSVAQIDEIRDKVVLVGGFSKMFSMTGLRLGYVCANTTLMEQIMKVHQYAVSCAPSIAQWGAYEGLKSCLDDVLYMKNEFIKRRNYLYDRLVSLGFETNLPKGAFYMFPSIKQFNISSEEFCERLLKEAKVAVVPGSAFGTGGEGYIRISYSYSMEELREALDRIEKWKGANF